MAKNYDNIARVYGGKEEKDYDAIAKHFGADLAATNEAQDRAQMTHDASMPTNPRTKYTRLAEGMTPMEGALATFGGNVVGAWRGMTGKKKDQEHEAAMAALRESAPGSFAGDLSGGAAIYAPSMFGPSIPIRAGLSALTGLVTTQGDIGERAMSGGMAAAGSLFGDAIPYAVKVGKAISAPTTQAGRDRLIGELLNRGTGTNRNQVVANLRAPVNALPGEIPTAAGVGRSGFLSAAQRWANQSDPESYAYTFGANQQARRDSLSRIAGTEADREAADQARNAAANKLYGDAFNSDARRIASQTAPDPVNSDLWWNVPKQKPLPVDTRIASMSDNPVLQAAKKEAVSLAKAEGKDIGDPFATLQGMHYMKLAMDSRLSGKVANTALARHSDRAVVETKKKLLGVMQDISPIYGTARQTYADMSQPINQMDIGKFLHDKLVSGLETERAGSFAEQLKNANEMVRKVTGGRQTLDQVMTPQQMADINGVRDSLLRKTAEQNLGRDVGSNTFQNIAMENLARQSGFPSFLGSITRALPVANAGIGMLKGVADSATRNYELMMRQRLSELVRDPKLLADIMDSAANPNALAKALNRIPNRTTRQLVFDTMRGTPAVMGAGLLSTENR